MTTPDEILAEQNAALDCVRRIAESLPGYQETGFDMSGKLNEAEAPRAVNAECPLTPNRPS